MVGGYGGKDQRPLAAESRADTAAALLSAGAAATVVGGFASMRAPAPAAVSQLAAAGDGTGRLRMNGCACCAMFTSDDTKGVRGRHLHSAELLLNFGDAQGKASDWTWVPGACLARKSLSFATHSCIHPIKRLIPSQTVSSPRCKCTVITSRDWCGAGPALQTARKGFADVCFDDGMLVIGGVDTDGNTLCGCEYLPPESYRRRQGGDAAAEAAPSEEGTKYSKGRRVAVAGLTGAPHYNGREGTVCVLRQRWCVFVFDYARALNTFHCGTGSTTTNRKGGMQCS